MAKVKDLRNVLEDGQKGVGRGQISLDVEEESDSLPFFFFLTVKTFVIFEVTFLLNICT